MGVNSFSHKVIVLLVASFLTPGSAFFMQNGSPFFKIPFMSNTHNFWKQFQHGFHHVEDAAKDEIDTLEGAVKSWLSPDSGDSSEIDRDREPLSSTDDFGLHDGIFNIFNSGPSRYGVWWKGPNVCVEREEIDESQHKNSTESQQDEEDGIYGSFHFSSCQQTEIKYTCKTKIRSHGIRKTFVVKYQCCHGFKRVPGNPGCTEVHLKSLMETIDGVGAHDFIELLRTSRLEDKLTTDNLTIFVPSDDAIRDFTDSVQETNQVEFYVPTASARKRRSSNLEGTSMKEIVLGHMTQGFHDISEMVNEEVLYSDNNNSSIHLNVYPAQGEQVVTANCARVTSMNNYATNGIVHVVDRVIQPVSKTLAELIAQDDQFTILKSMLGKADLLKQLSEPGHFTLFAPTNSAFDKMDAAVKKRLMEADTCITNVVRHHLLSHVLCSAAIQSQAITANLGGNTLTLERHQDDGKLFVNDVQIVVKDIMATNGIIHVVDEVLMPDSGRPVTGVLTSHNLTTFVSLLVEAGLADSLDAMSNVTLFAPTDAALAKPEAVAELEKAKRDKDKLRDLLLYHTTGPEVQGCNLANNQELKTGLDDKSIRINLYSTLPFFSGAVNQATAECARLVRFDSHACGGVVHEVDRLLVPPTHSILEILEMEGNFTILNRIVKNAELEAELKENAPFTLLAPTDDAFSKLDDDDVQKLMEDKKLAVHVLKQHILPEVLCCAGIMSSSWPFVNRVETLAGHSINIRRDHENRIHVGSTTVQNCDLMATNGVIHTVNRVMAPQGYNRVRLQRISNPNVEVFLYGI